MGFNAYVQALGLIGYKTEAAGTVIYKMIDPRPGCRTVIQRATILTGATAHVLTVMRPLASTTSSASAEASQKVVDFTADPGSIAADDYCVLKLSDGSYQLNMVASVSTLEVTFTDNLTAAMASGAKIWFLGTASDDHEDRVLTADTENNFESEVGEFLTAEREEPIVFSIDNGTNASVIEGGTVAYVRA